MSAGSIRKGRAFLEIVGRERLGPAIAKAKALLAGFAKEATKLGGKSIGSPVPAAAAKAAASRTAATRAIAAQVGKQAGTTRGTKQTTPEALAEVAAALKASGQASAITAGSLRKMSEGMGGVSTEALRMSSSIAQLVPALRAMTQQIRSMGAISNRAIGSERPPAGSAVRPRGSSLVAAGALVSGAVSGTPALAAATVARLGAAWRLAGNEIRLVSGVLGAAGQGLDRAGRFARSLASDMTRVGLTMKLAGLATLGFVAASVRTFANAGSAAYDMSQRLGISAEAWSELSFAAQQAGADGQALELSLRKMQDVVIQAATGSEAAARSLEAIGLGAAQLVGLAPERQLELIADGIASIRDPAARTALALDVFGRNAGRLLPLLTGGASGIAAARDEARKLGITISTADAAAADKLGDSLSALGAVAKKAFFAIGASIAPALSKGVGLATTAVVGVVDWIKANGSLVTTIVAVGAGLTAIGAVLVTLAPVASALAGGVVALGTALSVAGTAVGLLASPLGLIAAAAAGLVGTLLVLSGSLDSVGSIASSTAARAVAGFASIRAIASSTIAGIASALQAGNTKVAAEIFWKGLEVAWKSGAESLRDIWNGVMDELPSTWDQLVNRMAKSLTILEDELMSLWERAQHASANTVGTALSELWEDPKSILHAMGPVGTMFASLLDSMGIGALSPVAAQVLDESANRPFSPNEARKKETEERLKALDEEYRQAKEKAKQEREAGRLTRQTELAALKAELDALVARANAEAANNPNSDPKAPPAKANATTQAIADVLAKLTGSTRAAGERLEAAAAVTFAGSRAGGLGSGSVERLNRAAERTAKNTEQIGDILRALQGLDLSFGEG